MEPSTEGDLSLESSSVVISVTQIFTPATHSSTTEFPTISDSTAAEDKMVAASNPVSTPTLHPAIVTKTTITGEAEELIPPHFSNGENRGFPREVNKAEVTNVLSKLTLEQKIGQLQMVGMPGAALDQLTRRRIVEMGVGGIVFLEHNVPSPEQTLALTSELQDSAIEQGPGLPLFIGWNHEGGRVVRRGAGVTRFPSNMAINETNDPNVSYLVGQAIGKEMLSLGVKMNFAPVLDLNTEMANPVIGLRSYGDDPGEAAILGREFIRGLQDAGVIAVAKHFPGHGGVDVDSHLALPLLDRSLDQLWQQDLLPFQTAVDTNVAAVMVAHLNIPALDNMGLPSSLSPTVINDLLRDQLGYDGVIMTDSLGMRAVTDYFSPGEAAVQALLAGNDLLLSTESQTYPELIHDALVRAVQNGRISEGRIDESVRRIIELKLAYDIASPAQVPLLADQADHRALAEEIGIASVQVLRDEAGWLPLPLNDRRIVVISPSELNAGSISGNQLSLLGEKLVEHGVEVIELFYDYKSPVDIASVQTQAGSLAASVDGYVVVMWDAILRNTHFQETAQEDMVSTMVSTGKPVVVVFGSLPYDSHLVPNTLTQVALYGDTDGQIEGLVQLIINGQTMKSNDFDSVP
jgi:beta-N-acetylhexosaminidase